MALRLIIALLAAMVLAAPAHAKRETLRVAVAAPYLEMHTGPGRGYPVFHVVERGSSIEVLKQRTSWFQVRTERGLKGWVAGEQLAATLQADGAPLVLAGIGRSDADAWRREVGVSFGDFDGASSISLLAGWRSSRHLALELMASQLSGRYSDGWMAGGRLVHTPFPEWRLSPYLLLGTGVIHISPRASLVSTEDRTDQYAQAGIGLRAWLGRRFMFRAEYLGDVVFTSRDDNEEVEEWKAGFSVFF
ncbi:MAG: SH3 domain-containing protein [Gammaproteobacteria bacterium]|nr:SH3 domain-containing protein [Gammaproteobacteria bacterium]